MNPSRRGDKNHFEIHQSILFYNQGCPQGILPAPKLLGTYQSLTDPGEENSLTAAHSSDPIPLQLEVKNWEALKKVHHSEGKAHWRIDLVIGLECFRSCCTLPLHYAGLVEVVPFTQCITCPMKKKPEGILQGKKHRLKRQSTHQNRLEYVRDGGIIRLGI